MFRMPTTKFAARLKELREIAGLTQLQLAEKVCLSLGAIRNLEQGINGATFETAVALAAALGVDCRAFNDEPAERGPSRSGRPPKTPPVAAGPPAAPKKRGRPKKA